jgi:hypothetical protein
MKKLKLMLAIALIAVAMPGFAQKKKVAVVTFYADRMVDLSDVGLTGLDVVSELANDPTFNLQPLLDQYHEKFFKEYAPKFPFEIVSETVVTGNAAYQAYKPEYAAGYEITRYVTSPGYIPVDAHIGKKNIQDMVKMFPDVDGVMFVYLDFAMNKGFGVGGTATTKMQAYTSFVLYNTKAEKVFIIREHANSKKTGVMVGGVPVMKPAKVLPMCESALTELMEDLDKRIQKIIDKSAKKL